MSFGNSPTQSFGIYKAGLTAPSDLALTVDSDTEITLNWTDGAADGAILIERSLEELTGFVQIAEVPIGDETYQDTELEPETEYFYRIRAYDISVGYSDYSATESDTTDPA